MKMYPEKIASALDFERAAAADEGRAAAEAVAWANSGHLARLLPAAKRDSRLWRIAKEQGYDDEGRPPVPGPEDAFEWDALRRCWVSLAAPEPVPVPVPEEITARQFFKALAEDGNGEDTILMMAKDEGFSDAQMLDLRAELKGNYFRRDNPLIGLLAPVLGYNTDALVDGVFQRGAQFR
jgi:hypothetical protein